MIGDDDVAFFVAVTTSVAISGRCFHFLVNAAKILEEAKKVAAQGLECTAILVQHGQQERFTHSLEKLPALNFCEHTWRKKEVDKNKLVTMMISR